MDNNLDKLKDLGWYHANGGKQERIKRYRSFLSLDESVEITEDNLDPQALAFISCRYNCPADRVKAELLGQKWSDLEED